MVKTQTNMKLLLAAPWRKWRSLSPRVQWGLLIGGGVIVACLFFVPVPPLSTIRQWVEQTSPWAPLTYLLLMVAFTQFPIPRTVWTLAAGILFPPVVGISLMMMGLGISAGVSLMVVRRIGSLWTGRGSAETKNAKATEESAQAQRLSNLVEDRGWIAVLGLRMVPAVPFSVLNYACALISIPLGPFLFATIVGSLPNTVALVLAASALTSENGADQQGLMLGLSVGLILLGLAIAAREMVVWRRMLDNDQQSAFRSQPNESQK